ncbi:MAG TPA: hypothetical protein VMU92_08555 [Acidobacteriaceae bacterium]|nr:hypothetical protein [Acidobacteriaceae bacterium]
MNNLGYSTGDIALGDFTRAIKILKKHPFHAIKLSALRINEVEPLINALPQLDLSSYKYVSFHAPSAFAESDEEHLVSLLQKLPVTWPIVLHPDTIHDFSLWKVLADRLAIENMDRRKSTGRSVIELRKIFTYLPTAKMCLDIGHARQVDSSMIETFLLLTEFRDKIVQLHVSEVDTSSRHDVLSIAAQMAFRQLRPFIPQNAAIIVESRVSEPDIDREAESVANTLTVPSAIPLMADG